MFCPKCGKEIPDTDQFCPFCGAPVAAEEKPVEPENKAVNFDPEDIVRSRYLAALCYINPIFMIIGLLVEPNSKFIRYHMNQSIMLDVFSVALILIMIIPFLGWIIGAVGSIAAVVFMIMGILHAVKGEAIDLPLVGKYTVIHYD